MKPTITAADIKHREDFKEFVISDADKSYKPILRKLYSLWDTYTTKYVEEPMTPPYIMLSNPSRAQAFGDYSPVSGFGGHSQIRIRLNLLNGAHKAMKTGDRYAEGRFLFVADVLLHETLHQYHQEVTGHTEDSYKGHGPHFRDSCNEIGEALGLPPVRVAKARGSDKELPSCAQWPHCVRPKNYYHGAYIETNGRKTGKDFDEEIKAKRATLKKLLGDERSGAIITLIEAAQNFSRFWPDGTEDDALSLLPDLGRAERKQVLSFLRAAREVDVDL
ncbi:MAG: hypothetical protein MOB07_30520 [Acidobacteria bacterium]|nr:hypothetical protein [Acidobacteriota bacterium]